MMDALLACHPVLLGAAGLEALGIIAYVAFGSARLLLVLVYWSTAGLAYYAHDLGLVSKVSVFIAVVAAIAVTLVFSLLKKE